MRRALVTGVSRGIGLEVARMLLSEGWSVYGVSRTASPLCGTPGFWGFERDVAQFKQMPMWAAHRPLDALVHCAAIQGPAGPLEANTPTAWAKTVMTNLVGTSRVVQTCLPWLHRSDDARVLLFSGGGAFNPRPNHSAYAASKAGVVSLMETLADELRHSTVAVNCVAPGYVPTAIHGPDARPDGGEAMREAVACVRHLLSPAAYGLSGKTISAPHDAWRDINPMTVARVNASVMGTRSRHPIALVGARRGVVV